MLSGEDSQMTWEFTGRLAPLQKHWLEPKGMPLSQEQVYFDTNSI